MRSSAAAVDSPAATTTATRLDGAGARQAWPLPGKRHVADCLIEDGFRAK